MSFVTPPRGEMSNTRVNAVKTNTSAFDFFLIFLIFIVTEKYFKQTNRKTHCNLSVVKIY